MDTNNEIKDLNTKEEHIPLPSYTRKEELINTISHIVGAVLGLVALIMLLIISVQHENLAGIITSIVYAISIMVLYSCSAYYHGLRHIKAKKVFRVLDHCAIFFLIAGTYTVISISGVVPVHPVIGWTAVFFVTFVIDAISLNGFLLILFGGIAYSLGAILYGIGKKRRYFHSVFHVFCLIGTIIQFVGITLYCV